MLTQTKVVLKNAADPKKVIANLPDDQNEIWV